ncbi:hypothetical protein [Agaribacter marinus]|uniref:Uncharacterized protein n=1 Tax=Agaribacter marinus TaxID=1431249 RepID=A0AA37WJ40_9ALTE|nr:hypothetical protein [Agaribacter marinus]GLR71898.1 hypothetical protein GCM10007852_28060 [Agaribacter marinus]
MTIKLQAKKELRIVPVRFERAATGSPDAAYPEVDDRGHTHTVPQVNGLAASDPIRGGVLGLTKDQEVTIQMVREDIDNNAELYVTTSDEEVVKIITPKDGEKVASGKENKIKLKGGTFSGSTPKSGKVEIRFGAKDGPIIANLVVYTFNRLLVFIQPHIVTVNDPSGANGVAPTLNIDNVMKQVKALWAPCGVHFTVNKAESFDIKLANANKMLFSEVNNVYAKKWVKDTINVYVMQELDSALGYGFSKSAYAGFGLTHPGVFMGMKTGATDRTAETYWCANDLAHELGHFFTLWHPTDGSGSGWQRYETWSMRFLMHNYNYTGRAGAPQGGAHWPEYNNFGYGSYSGYPYRSGLVSLKNVRTGASAGRDGQCSTVRNHIAQGPSVLY